MQKTITTCVLLLLLVRCFSQFNDSTHYHFRYAGTGALNKTNTAKSYIFSNNAGFNISQKKLALDASASYNYGQQNRVLTNNDFNANTTLDFRKSKKSMYEWGLANYQTSFSLQIAYKVQVGAGIGFTILDSPRAHLNISDGFLYEANNLQDDILGNDVYSTVRNSFRLKYKFIIAKSVTLNGTDFVQPSILSIKDYILGFNNDVSFKLNQWLNLMSAISYNRINRTGRRNLLLTFGLSADKYF